MKKDKSDLSIALGLGGLALGRIVYDPLPGYSLDGIIAAQATWFLMVGNQAYGTIKSTKKNLLEISLVFSPFLLGSGIEYLQHIGVYRGTGDINDLYAYLTGSLLTFCCFKVPKYFKKE